MRLLIIPTILVLLATPAIARPVSYPGGWTIMQMNDALANSVHIHYSPTARYSIGYKGEYFRDGEWSFNGLQLNNLLHRWNKPNSQANLYLKSGLGIAYSNQGYFENKSEASSFTGFAADWENRRYFTSYENRVFYAGDIEKSFSQKARFGFAPYIGDYGDVHTWLMLQLNHDPSAEEKLTLTPLIRLFKGANLLEAGANNNGKILFNFIHRF